MRAAVTLEATDAVNSFKFRVDGWSFICVKKKEEVFATASVVSFEYWAVRKPVCRRVGFFGYGPGAVRNKTNGPANKVENFYFYYFFSFWKKKNNLCKLQVMRTMNGRPIKIH